MADQIEIQLPKTVIQEDSVLTATVSFRTRASAAASTPTTVRYRLDCLTTSSTVLDWTSASPASSVSIAVTGAQNAIIDDANDYEVKQLVVQADAGLSTQQTQRKTWRVENIFAV